MSKRGEKAKGQDERSVGQSELMDGLETCACSGQEQEIDSLCTNGEKHDYFIECITCSKRTGYCETADKATKQWAGMAGL